MDKRLVITIGRQCGSGGRRIGQMLAEQLGIKCYDKEILNRAAKESGLAAELFETHDEKPTSSFLYSCNGHLFFRIHIIIIYGYAYKS